MISMKTRFKGFKGLREIDQKISEMKNKFVPYLFVEDEES